MCKRKHIKVFEKHWTSFSIKEKIAKKMTVDGSEEKELNNIFQNVTKTFNITENSRIVGHSSNFTYLVNKAITTWKSHCITLLTEQKLENMDRFLFINISISEMVKEFWQVILKMWPFLAMYYLFCFF